MKRSLLTAIIIIAVSANALTAQYPFDEYLIGHWRFDETFGKTAVDQTGNNDGTINTNHVTLGVPGIKGTAFRFDGIDDDNAPVNMGNGSIVAALAGNVDMSWSYWAKADANATENNTVLALVTSVASNIYVQSGHNNGSPYGKERIGDTAETSITNTGTTSFKDNRWHHVVYIIDADAGHKLFVDGVLEASDNLARMTAGKDFDRFAIGCLYRGENPTKPTDYFAGDIDEVRIYNAALNADDVYQLYRENPISDVFVIGHWSFDDPDNIGADLTQYANHGTVHNVVSSIDAVSGISAKFDAANSSTVLIDVNPDLDPELFPENEITVGFWFKTEMDSTNAHVVSHNGNFSPLEIGDDGTAYSTAFTKYNGGSGEESEIRAVFDWNKNNYADDEWHYLTATFKGSDESGTVTTYIDGNEVASATKQGDYNLLEQQDTPWMFGGSEAGTDHYSGLIDDIMVFNTALSADAALLLYRQYDFYPSRADRITFVGINSRSNETGIPIDSIHVHNLTLATDTTLTDTHSFASNPGDMYTFIGFAKNFENDTLSNIVAQKGDTLKFYFDPLYPAPDLSNRPFLLFNAGDHEILKARHTMMPEGVSGKANNIVNAWFSDDEEDRKRETKKWIDYWKNYATRWTQKALSKSDPDGVSMRGIWRTMHLFDIVASWGYLTEYDIVEYRDAVVNAVELALGTDVNNLGAQIQPDFKTHNIYSDVVLAAGIVGYSFPELAQAEYWVAFAEREVLWQLDNAIYGDVWHQCPRYHGYVLKLCSQYFQIAKNRSGVDYFQHEKFKAMAEWFVHFSTPKVKMAGDIVLIPGFGDTTWDTEWHGSLNIVAQHYKVTDPELSKAIAWIWQEAGSPYITEPVMDLLVDPDINSACQELASVISEEKGYILMRDGHGTEDETWFILKCGKASKNGHENEDWNSFSLFAYGQPMSLDAGSGDYNDDNHEKWNEAPIAHNMVVFRSPGVTDPFGYDRQSQSNDGKVLFWHTDKDVDYSITEASSPSRVKKNIRHVIFMKPDYFIIKDEIEHYIEPSKPSSWMLHTLSSETEWGKRDVTSHTLNNTALDLHLVLPDRDLIPNEWEGRIGAWIPGIKEDNDFYGYKYQKYFEVRAEAGEGYLMVLRPRRDTMPKLTVVSNDGGKTLEINTGDRLDVITFNGTEVVIQKGDKTINIATLVENDDLDELPERFELSQNYPNPFNPVTKIKIGIAKEESVSLSVYNLLGQRVASIVNEKLSPGYYSYDFNANNLSSGIYIYQLHSPGYVVAKKMMFMK